MPVPTGCYVIDGKYLFAGIGFILLALNELSKTSNSPDLFNVLSLSGSTVLMILALGVGVSRYRHSNNTLVAVLYRDGIFYYVFIFGK